ncbi:MAG: hypothetical protein WCK58_16170 [Chloroflexota bacterium]
MDEGRGLDSAERVAGDDGWAGATTPPGGPRRPTFRYRASTVLLINAVIALLGALVVPAADRSTEVSGMALAAAFTMVLTVGATSSLVSFGLDRGRRWAPTAAVAILWLTAVAGVVRFLAGLATMSLTIPIDTLLAWWALATSDRPRTYPVRPHVAKTLAPVVVMALVVAGPPLVGFASVPGRTPIAVGKDAIEPGISMVCPGPGGPFTSATATFDWRWARTDLLPAGVDGVAIGVTAPYGVRIGFGTAVGPEGSWQGSGGPSSGLIDAAAVGMDRIEWAIDIGQQGTRDGSASATILPANDNPTTGMFNITGMYAHGGAWIVSKELACSW